jgi:hypothetical protein
MSSHTDRIFASILNGKPRGTSSFTVGKSTERRNMLIPKYTVFEINRYQGYETSSNSMAIRGVREPIMQNRSKNPIPVGYYYFKEISRNVMTVVPYPPKSFTYGLINFRRFGSDSQWNDEKSNKERTITEYKIPLKLLQTFSDIDIRAMPPMGVLPVGTVVSFSKPLVDDAKGNPVSECFQKYFGKATFAKSLTKPTTEEPTYGAPPLYENASHWIVVSNAGANINGILVEGVEGRTEQDTPDKQEIPTLLLSNIHGLKRIQQGSYVLRRIKSIKYNTTDAPSVPLTSAKYPNKAVYSVEYGADNETNTITIDALKLHECLKISDEHNRADHYSDIQDQQIAWLDNFTKAIEGNAKWPEEAHKSYLGFTAQANDLYFQSVQNSLGTEPFVAIAPPIFRTTTDNVNGLQSIGALSVAMFPTFGLSTSNDYEEINIKTKIHKVFSTFQFSQSADGLVHWAQAKDYNIMFDFPMVVDDGCLFYPFNFHGNASDWHNFQYAQTALIGSANNRKTLPYCVPWFIHRWLYGMASTNFYPASGHSRYSKQWAEYQKSDEYISACLYDDGYTLEKEDMYGLSIARTVVDVHDVGYDDLNDKEVYFYDMLGTEEVKE